MAKGKQTREELIYAGMAALADTHGNDETACAALFWPC